MIDRAEKTGRLRELLAEHRIIYLSGFFGCGKTVLLSQLAAGEKRGVLRFDAADAGWIASARSAGKTGDHLILIDRLERVDEGMEREVSALLSELPERCRVVLAGRAQRPECLRMLLAGGEALQLGQEFVSFSEEEIRLFFEEQALSLLPDDIRFLRETALGWPLLLQITARRLRETPKRSVAALRGDVAAEAKQLLLREVFPYFSEQERLLLLSLAPFDRFTGEMARIVTGRTDAPRIMERIASKSYVLFFEPPNRYSFLPFVRTALFREMQNQYSAEHITGQYRRAALYYELQNELPQALAYYAKCGDTEKIRELLIYDTRCRPANGDYAELRSAYALLSEESILQSPELMKGACIIESLLGHPGESDRWYQELKDFVRRTSAQDDRRRSAEEALRYLDIGLAQRGTKTILRTLLSTARLSGLAKSESWRSGFNIAGNSVSLMDGGKDFCRWVPKGKKIYQKFRVPVELAIGRGGRGLADLAIGECFLESELSGEYAEAMRKVCDGLSRTSNDLELRCAGAGIQSRILAAQGDLTGARRVMEKQLASLPDNAPPRLRQNLTVHLLTLELYGGETQNARCWMDTEAPDETGDFLILDRYRYLFKLRLYIMSGLFRKTTLLAAKLRQYAEAYDRPYLRVKLHLLQAVMDRRSGGGDWREELASALTLAKQYRLARVIADEGIAVVEMLGELELPDGEWERGVLELTRTQAAQYPAYLKQFAERPVFTGREEQVYRLLAAGYSNAKIGAILNMRERTVKFHTAEIYKKLGVENRAEALTRAAELGDIR